MLCVSADCEAILHILCSTRSYPHASIHSLTHALTHLAGTLFLRGTEGEDIGVRVCGVLRVVMVTLGFSGAAVCALKGEACMPCTRPSHHCLDEAGCAARSLDEESAKVSCGLHVRANGRVGAEERSIG